MKNQASDLKWRLRRNIPHSPQFPAKQQLADRPALQPLQRLQHSIHRERSRRELPLLPHPFQGFKGGLTKVDFYGHWMNLCFVYGSTRIRHYRGIEELSLPHFSQAAWIASKILFRKSG